MPSVRRSDLPPESLLRRYAESGAYTDCFVTWVPQRVSHAGFVEAFYTTAIFRLERLILRVFASRPSSDAEARRLARGEAACFAAWTVEARTDNQLLLCDFAGRTRSWLMSAEGPDRTTLYFGSAVVPRRDRAGMGAGFTALLAFHKLYSRVLLSAAAARADRTVARSPRRDG